MSRLILEIDLQKLEMNARLMKSCLSPGVRMLSVVKADAYGHGSVQVAKMLIEKGLSSDFAVATAEEGACLRKAGIEGNILILGCSDEDDMLLAIKHSLIPTIYSLSHLKALSYLSKRESKTVKAHLKIETGMNRLGISPGSELIELLSEWKNTPNVIMDGVFSHFSSADSDKSYTDKQFEIFLSACSLISDSGFHPIRHIAASSALYERKYQLDMVRCGIALYGVGEGPLKDRVFPAQTLKTHPVRIRTAHLGEKIGYSQNYTCKKDTVVATIPCGYGDGYPRHLSNKGFVLVNGRRAPIIGNICMDMLMIDVTGIGEVNEKSEVVLLGRQEEECITPSELSDLTDTIPYEIMLGFTSRAKKTYRI